MNPIAFEHTFHQLFRAHYARLLVYARSFVGDEADDVVEEVFVQLWEQKETVELGDKALAWLYRAVFTRAMNVLRHRRVAASYIATAERINEQRMRYLEQTEGDGLRDLERQHLREEIERAISTLPERCRQTFRMSYQQGLSNAVIAEVMETSVRTVEAQMYKALRTLREQLRPLLTVFLLSAHFFSVLSKWFQWTACYLLISNIG